MIKEALQALNTGVMAEIGLFFFLFAFALLMVRTVFLVREKGKYAKNLPFDDGDEVTPGPEGIKPNGIA